MAGLKSVQTIDNIIFFMIRPRFWPIIWPILRAPIRERAFWYRSAAPPGSSVGSAPVRKETRNLVHGQLVVFRFEEMAITIHGHRRRAVASEGLDRLDRKIGIDPARNREVTKGMPVKAGRRLRVQLGIFGVKLFQLLEERFESALDYVGVTFVTPSLVFKNEVIRLFPLTLGLSCA